MISITDTGIGMNAGDMEQLGRPFFQVRSSLSRPYQGSGLGLSVVRGLVSLHDGTLDVRSSPGHGTTMTVRLPLCRHEPATANDGDDRVVAYRPPEHRTFDRLSDRLGERIDPARHSPSHSPRIKQIA